MNRIKHPRGVDKIVTGMNTQDGAGVRLTRVFPAGRVSMVDPFLLLDAFHSDNPDDYIAGFPPHPHRGFETVTYLLAGRFRHRDSAGHSGVVKAGGVQWMTAGRGIEHSEMPEQVEGLLEGFQLWVNLPAARKMTEPSYQEFEPGEIPVEALDNGVEIRVIAGNTVKGTQGVVKQIATSPNYFDVNLPAGTSYTEVIPPDHNAFIYMIGGEVQVLETDGQSTRIPAGRLAVLKEGDGLRLDTDVTSRLLLISGRPINEPIARHGPFVMNTFEEIQQAYQDYNNGLFGKVEEIHNAVA